MLRVKMYSTADCRNEYTRAVGNYPLYMMGEHSNVAAANRQPFDRDQRLPALFPMMKHHSLKNAAGREIRFMKTAHLDLAVAGLTQILQNRATLKRPETAEQQNGHAHQDRHHCDRNCDNFPIATRPQPTRQWHTRFRRGGGRHRTLRPIRASELLRKTHIVRTLARQIC